MSTKQALARLLWAEIAASGQSQADAAEMAGLTQKHLSQTINGHAGMQLDLVDRVLATCGRRLVLGTEPTTRTEDPQ